MKANIFIDHNSFKFSTKNQTQELSDFLKAVILAIDNGDILFANHTSYYTIIYTPCNLTIRQQVNRYFKWMPNALHKKFTSNFLYRKPKNTLSLNFIDFEQEFTNQNNGFLLIYSGISNVKWVYDEPT